MKNFCISIIALLLISCKATQYRTVSIDASKEDVWKVVSRLGDIHNYSALDSASITPPGEAKVGSIVFVTQGKNYGKSEVTFVEPSKTIKTKLIETSWPANYWNESWHLYEDGENTGLKYVIDFQGKGLANLGFPFLKAYNGSDMKKTVNNIKKHIESM
jgi:hypothetical protein|tara:strand:- start:1530 stop:2006 length:477 start_codon:yes stop_codon:yes gene_type:complete